VIDRFGRKWMMVASLALNGVYFILLGQADTYPVFAVLMVMGGFVNPVYRVGADAMLADLIEPEKRIDAYSVMRLSHNAGIAIGPAIGGFIASTSYGLAFLLAAGGMMAYSLMMLVFAKETLPTSPSSDKSTPIKREKFGGYLSVLRDWPFIRIVLAFIMVTVCASTMWVLMPVYAKQNYQIPESMYGFIPTTNALMVVFLQLFVTRLTKKHPPLLVMMAGAAFYTVATTSVSQAQAFLGFWIAMVVMTIGELVIVPTSSTYVANLAPSDKRGRYMSIYGLTWGAATGIGSLLGGFMNDTFGPRSIWYTAGLIGAIATFLFLSFYIKSRHLETASVSPSASIN
jgi:MFS family permease